LRLVWSRRALRDLERAAGWSTDQAAAVVNAMDWMAGTGLSVGRRVGDTDEWCWPVSPLGVFYRVDGETPRVLRVIDARRRRRPW
jgi:plasmid stabilization system protein ParE